MTCALRNILLYCLIVSCKRKHKRVVSSVGRAPALQAGCHQFESGTTHILKSRLYGGFFSLNT